jgi:chaperonin GroES
MKLQPLRDDVLVRVLPGESQTKGGILIPETSRGLERWSHCRVEAVGPGRVTSAGRVIPMEVGIGDVVLTEWRAGTRIADDEDERLVKYAEILAVVGTCERKVFAGGPVEVDETTQEDAA